MSFYVPIMSPPQPHSCVGGVESANFSWWEKDGQGIPLCRVCNDCIEEKLSQFRPEILRPYSQDDVEEPIDDY